MTDTSKKTYRELAFPYFKEVFIAIDKVCGELGIAYYLIGAQGTQLSPDGTRNTT